MWAIKKKKTEKMKYHLRDELPDEMLGGSTVSRPS